MGSNFGVYVLGAAIFMIEIAGVKFVNDLHIVQV